MLNILTKVNKVTNKVSEYDEHFLTNIQIDLNIIVELKDRLAALKRTPINNLLKEKYRYIFADKKENTIKNCHLQ